jgi:hypothetical protein
MDRFPDHMGIANRKPKSRTEGLLTEEVDGEVLVYDENEFVACRLNKTAAFVWRQCNGKRTIPQLVALVQAEFGDGADEDVTLIALDELTSRQLIKSGYDQRTPGASKYSRRRFLRRVGLASVGTTLLPIVYSIAVPAPAAAASGFMYHNNYFPYVPTA